MAAGWDGLGGLDRNPIQDLPANGAQQPRLMRGCRFHFARHVDGKVQLRQRGLHGLHRNQEHSEQPCRRS
jgi:hypothetical protein